MAKSTSFIIGTAKPAKNSPFAKSINKSDNFSTWLDEKINTSFRITHFCCFGKIPGPA